MSIYRRYISKSVIFFSVFFVIFFLFIESSVGFKYIFNFTNRIFIGLKAEEISGNWRDFTLKNIKYDVFGISITANSLHIVLDTRSLFKMSTIFKKIETKNVILSLKKNTASNFSQNSLPSKISKNIFFIKYPIILKKIHADKILFTSPKVRVSFLDVLSGIKLVGNNIIFSPTYINTIHVSSAKFNFEKKNILNKSTIIKNFNKIKKIYSFSYFSSNQTKKNFPLNIYLKSLKCNKTQFIDYEYKNLLQVELQANIENNILQINKMKVDSSFLKMNSYGKVIFNNDYSISCVMNSKTVIPSLYNKSINFQLKANFNVDHQLIFKLISKDLYNMKINGLVFLNFSDYPFFIKLQSRNLSCVIKKNYIFKLKSFDGVLKGYINNYFFSLKNIFTLQDLPPIFIDIQGRGDLNNIFLKKINFFPIKQKKFYKKVIHPEDYIKYNQYILKLIGQINITGKSDRHTHYVHIPKIDLYANIMKKKLSILGALYYKNFNFIETPGINLLLGKNKLYLRGSLGKKYNIYSSIYANNLDYFFPKLQGRIQAKVNFLGNNKFPIISSKILARDLNWNNIYFKNIKVLTGININNTFSGKMLIYANKIHFYKFYINTLHIQTYSNNHKQNFSFLLKSNRLHINLIINGAFNNKTGHWHGFFKKINIRTFWGQVTAKKNNFIHYYDSHNSITNFYQKSIKKRNCFSSFLYNVKMSFFNLFNRSFISFESKLSINAKLKLILGKMISDGAIFLKGNNTKLEKKINKKIFIQNIDFFKISMNLIKNDFKSKWIIKKNKKLSNNKNIFGYLNIIDIYNKKNIKGEFIFYKFPFSFINFFTTNFKEVSGKFQSKIKLFGTLYQPKVLADVHFKNIFIRSNNILKYITLFFPYFLGKVDNIKINQEIMMNKGNILFTLKPFFKNNSADIEWNIVFNSKKISVLIFPKIKVKFSSKLNLHYLFSKYDLIGYIKFSLFYFQINEKNFIF
ncbi:translocation/assembly module TamB domain-containing protein [Buchnera aphidicola]|uniref:translocation/assembly module TamB domain-containing protein n=1 Tax=Buchnera aphidicola TaxID=9 RepID=UPI0001ECFEFE|nr:translocation/assembly module TamB domain-containing protein [Buchnera aphidicola]ADP67062.1 hypothetical protein CWS_00425 [Buchnera aphidicola str. JF99 (Acyrthosiphon pisum)]